MGATLPDGWTGAWRVTSERADAYGVQLDFPRWGDGSSTNGHVVVPLGEPPLVVTREAGSFTLHGAPGDRSGAATFAPDPDAVASFEQRVGRRFTVREQLAHALFDVTMAYGDAFREAFPAATYAELFNARFFRADEAFLQTLVAEHPAATPQDLIVASMRRVHEGRVDQR
jgi:hypothetical protein